VLEGNYETYVDMVRRRAAEEASKTASASSAANMRTGTSAVPERDGPKKDRRKRKFPYRKAADIEADILDHESQVEAAQAKMLLPETLRDGRLVKQLQADIERLRAELQQLYEHWEEAAELNS